MKQPTLIVDTREQKAYTFKGCRSVKRALKVGDYSVVGHSTSGIVVERKAFGDFFSSFTSGRDEMMDKLMRMSKFRVSALVVEGSVADIRAGYKYTSVNGSRLLRTVLTVCAYHGVLPLFCDDAKAGEFVTKSLLLEYVSQRPRRNAI